MDHEIRQRPPRARVTWMPAATGRPCDGRWACWSADGKRLGIGVTPAAAERACCHTNELPEQWCDTGADVTKPAGVTL